MTDGYVVDPQVLRSVAGTLRSRADANGTAGSHGLDGRVDAGRSSGETAKALRWLREELEKVNTSLDALAGNVQGVADRYQATDEGSARDYDGARTPVPSAGPGAPR